MRRRKAVKAIALSTLTPNFLFRDKMAEDKGFIQSGFESQWHQWPDMLWTGPEYWANRLQDWQLRGGKAVCIVREKDRTLHCLTCQLSDRGESFETHVTVELPAEVNSAGQKAGFMIGAKGKFDDYRSAAVFGQGLRAGITGNGRLFVGTELGHEEIPRDKPIILSLQASPQDDLYKVTIRAVNGRTSLGELVASNIPSEALKGNIALLSHFDDPGEQSEIPSVLFSTWSIRGPKVNYNKDHEFGPVCFAQYTLHKGLLKLTAQLAPIENIEGHGISLQINDGKWRTIKEASIDPLGRSAHFRVENWNHLKTMPYRVRIALPLKGGLGEYFYEGRIAREPVDSSLLKMAVFSCNGDHGFPDADVPFHVKKHKPDLAVFLGDQFYESTGGFGIQTSPLEKSSLDYLRKWYMFGWSYREIFRNVPSACIPDDHDVYHGNVWGEGGKHAPTDEGWGYVAQDQGGYKMPPEWVNMVQRTQTSHLPDPYDNTPVNQGIGVYYTTWNYAGVSMAILEDRKFKSAPKLTLPQEANVVNGFIQNPDFNIREHYHVDADLLGDRQMNFLRDWVSDWKDGVEMKAVLSQTNFCAVATLPEGSILDNMVPQLPIPQPGEYVDGDAPTSDMDSNGWPQKGRDEALKIIRKCFALHIAGDQHLASMVQYGVDEFRDSGFAFAGPALNNIWPRRWWPPVDLRHQSIKGQPKYTGDFEDGFGNRMTVLAVANPRQTQMKPSIIYDRATGYGIVTFDKKNRTMKIECWPRHADPEKDPEGQYQGWPITVKQQENYGRSTAGFLPTLRISGVEDPVVEIINESTGEIEYILRIKGNVFRPKIFSASSHTVKVSDSLTGMEKIIRGVSVATTEKDVLKVDL